MTGVRGLVCFRCNKKVLKHDEGLTCAKCSGFLHLKCSDVDIDEFMQMRQDKVDKAWECPRCLQNAASVPASVHGNDANQVDDAALDPASSSLTPRDRLHTGGDNCCCISINSLIDENKTLKDIVNSQSATIVAIYEEIKELKILMSSQQALLSKIANAGEHKKLQRPANNSGETVKPGGSKLKSFSKTSTEMAPGSGGPDAISRTFAKVTMDISQDTEGSCQSSAITRPRNESSKDNVARVKAGKSVQNVETFVSDPSLDRDGFTKVINRKRNRTIVGKKGDDDSLRTVEARSWVFISRLHPSTTVDEVVEYAKKNSLPVEECERLDIRSQTISAFKFSIPKSMENRVMAEDAWPVNAIVRKYFRRANFQRREVADPLT